MPDPSRAPGWTRHLVYRTEKLKTTWKFRLGLFALIVGTAWVTSGWWTVGIARSLACDANAVPSDAILAENFDTDYLVLERAGELRRRGLAPRIFVPVKSHEHTLKPSEVALGTTMVVAQIARAGEIEIVPIREVEPISLNAARDVLQFVKAHGVQSVVVVAPVLRSRRSALVYNATLGRAGIRVRCEPVHGATAAETWTQT